VTTALALHAIGLFAQGLPRAREPDPTAARAELPPRRTCPVWC
jgi:hypothetical protein